MEVLTYAPFCALCEFLFVHYVSFFLGGKWVSFCALCEFFLGGKCVRTYVRFFYDDKTKYQLFFFCEMFRHQWPVVVSWPWQPWRLRDRGLSSLQRSNGSGGFNGSGLNITTRVSKNIMDAYTHPNWYPLGYISEWFQFPIGFFLHFPPWMWVDSWHRKTIP
jgi:hypothetical protein